MGVAGHMKLQLCIILTIIVQYSVCEECTLHKTVHDSKASLNNISALNGLIFSVVHDSFNYRISICKTILDNYPAASAIKTKVTDSKSSIVIGRYNDTHIGGSIDEGMVLLSYGSGDKYTEAGPCLNSSWKTTLVITCTKGVNELFFVGDDDTEHCVTVLHLQTQVLCPPVPPPGLGNGSVFCLLILTGVLIYLTVGIAYRRVMTGAQGLEQIPHYQFWRDLGNLQADGCDLVCRRKFSNREESWNRITSNFNDSADEPLLHP
uniref:MRH domain-containing protein n=1 Tax=Clastoptera arizonana TaxID=38151 RepID=A0A1B6EAI0_9HEMI